MSALDGNAVSFPKGFLFGAATAAYQVEGSVDVGGRGLSIWDTFSHTSGKTVNGDTGDIACDHFLRCLIHPLKRAIIAPSEKRIRTLIQAIDAGRLARSSAAGCGRWRRPGSWSRC